MINRLTDIWGPSEDYPNGNPQATATVDRAEEMTESPDTVLQQVVQFLVAHPVGCLLTAFAVGILLGRKVKK